MSESKENFMKRIFMRKLLMEYLLELESDPVWVGRVQYENPDPQDPNYVNVRFYLGKLDGN